MPFDITKIQLYINKMYILEYKSDYKRTKSYCKRAGLM